MVYPIILALHNGLRWLVLGSLLAVLINSYAGWLRSGPDSKSNPLIAPQTLRIVATSIAHTQLLVGIYLYTLSPIVSYYWKAHPRYSDAPEFSFFALIHMGLMVTSIVLMTIGSSKAKRQTDTRQKFRTTAIYFTIGLVLILVAIPWPFSPLAARPWVRTF
jgi:hypothetical protein